MDLSLDRFSYAKSETEGVLIVNDFSLATIERPWIGADTLGGKPFQSCVPDGEYILEPWTRPLKPGQSMTKGAVYILYNPELGVYKTKDSRPLGVGRYLILIHIANWVTNVVGCIGPGIERAIMRNPKTGKNERSVSSSGEAMRILIDQLGRTEHHRLTIRSVCGTQ